MQPQSFKKMEWELPFFGPALIFAFLFNSTYKQQSGFPHFSDWAKPLPM